MTQKCCSSLYQQTILTHYKTPKNFGKITNPCCIINGQNRMCGDYVTLYLHSDTHQITRESVLDISFEGEGCAILMASASMMTELIKGRTVSEILRLMREFNNILLGKIEYCQDLGDLNIFSGIVQFQSRIKCAMLAWDTLMKEIKNNVK
jgi:nitrogen fixation protein NifU and related proteins